MDDDQGYPHLWKHHVPYIRMAMEVAHSSHHGLDMSWEDHAVSLSLFKLAEAYVKEEPFWLTWATGSWKHLKPNLKQHISPQLVLQEKQTMGHLSEIWAGNQTRFFLSMFYSVAALQP